MSYSALSGSFEYLCYGSTPIGNIFIISVRGSSRAERVKPSAQCVLCAYLVDKGSKHTVVTRGDENLPK